MLFIARGASRLPAPGGRGGGRLHNSAFLAPGWERKLSSGVKNNPELRGHGACHRYLRPRPRPTTSRSRAVPRRIEPGGLPAQQLRREPTAGRAAGWGLFFLLRPPLTSHSSSRRPAWR